jgi:hypothetical protein
MKNKKHELLIEKAKEAINDLFSDTSVSKNETKGDMEDLLDEIQIKISTLK